MTLVCIDGFDLQDSALKGWAGTLTPVSTTPWSYGFALRTNSVSSTKLSLPSAIAQIFMGCAFQVSSSSSSDQSVARIYGDTGATLHLNVGVNPVTNVVNLRLAGPTGTILGTYSSPIALGSVWHYVEVWAVIADSGGRCQVRLDGTLIIDFTGDTKNAGTSTNIDAIGMGPGDTGSSITWDDLYVFDATGSTNNSFIGPWVRVQTLKPSGAGSSTQFTPLSGTNFSNVNDVPDNTATYNSDTVSGHRDTFAMDDLLSGSSNVFAVQQVMHARQLDGGTATIKQAQKSGATISYGATRTLTASNAGYIDRYETNPATSAAWAVSDLNALEAGYEVV